MPLYESNQETVKSLIATFFEAFPQGILWSNDREGHGYDAILFGQVEPTVIDVDAFQERLEREDHKQVSQSLHEVGFGELNTGGEGAAQLNDESVDLLSTYSGQASMLEEWTRGAQINRDRNLRLQYLAGMSLNSYIGERILAGLLDYYRFPTGTFVGSPPRLDALNRALERRNHLSRMADQIRGTVH